MTKIEIYDTTLRDGAQSDGINFSVSDKLKIIKILDDLGVDYIEAGWPGANFVDDEIFKNIKNIKLANSKIAAFGCTRKPDTLPKDDKVLNMLLASGTDTITIFGKTWDFHVLYALNTTLEENLNMISSSIKYLKDNGKQVFFDAEHFFDGIKHNKEYSLLAIEAAVNARADGIILCDTNGGCINNEIYKYSKMVVEKYPNMKFGIHTHNDSELAVANSIAAVDAGVLQVQGTINGYGERCGNANLCSVIPNLQLKKEYNVLGDKIKKLVHSSKLIGEIANVAIPQNTSFVGASAFAHKAGIHASGISKNSKTYEHIDPEAVGNTRKILISDQAGAASVREKLNYMRLIDGIEEKDIPKILEYIKQLEWSGYAFEGAEASFELMVMKLFNKLPQYFEILNLRVIGDHFDTRTNIKTEASVKVKVGDEIFHTVSEGGGPVDAIDKAFRKSLEPIFPQIKRFKLSDFKVRILNSKAGTEADVRVNIETTDGFNTWDTVGVSKNVIKASFRAIIDSLVYGLALSDKLNVAELAETK